MFDTQVFVIPREDVVNYFIWRQQDWIRNSLHMWVLFHFSHQEVHGLNKRQLHEKLFTEKGVNWAHLPMHLKHGTCVYKAPCVVQGPNETTAGVIRTVWAIDREPPVFTPDREYIEHHVFIDSGIAKPPRQKNGTTHDE